MFRSAPRCHPLAGMFLLVLPACDPDKLSCGPGTHEADGACLPDAAAGDDSGDPTGEGSAGEGGDGGEGGGADSDGCPDDSGCEEGGGEEGGGEEGGGEVGGEEGGGEGGDSYTVCATGAPFTHIQDAVDAAAEGEVISICAGTYEEIVALTGVAVSLIGDSAETTVIDARHAGIALSVTNGQGLDTTLRGLTLRSGEAEIYGGGLYVEGSSPLVEDLVIEDSHSEHAGGGVGLKDSDAVLDGLRIAYNSAETAGSGVFVYGGAPTLAHLVVEENDSGSYGAVYTTGSDLWLYNALIVGNSSHDDVSGLYVGEGTSNLIFNVVVAFNSCVYENDFAASIGTGEIYNSIIYQNTGCRGLSVGGASSYNLSYGHTDCNFARSGSACATGTLDIEADPRFNDAVAGDYTLSAISPAINTGNPASGYNDPDGSRNDLGAYGGPYGSWP